MTWRIWSYDAKYSGANWPLNSAGLVASRCWSFSRLTSSIVFTPRCALSASIFARYPFLKTGTVAVSSAGAGGGAAQVVALGACAAGACG